MKGLRLLLARLRASSPPSSKNYVRPTILCAILTVAVVLLLAWHHNDKPQRQWVRTHYDAEGTAFYPVCSSRLPSRARFGRLWNIAVKGVDHMCLGEFEGYKHPMLAVFGERQLVLIDGIGTADTVVGYDIGYTGAIDWDEDGFLEFVRDWDLPDTTENCAYDKRKLFLHNWLNLYYVSPAVKATEGRMKISRSEYGIVFDAQGNTILSVAHLLPPLGSELKLSFPDVHLGFRKVGPGYPASDRFSRLLAEPALVREGAQWPRIRGYVPDILLRRFEAYEVGSGEQKWMLPVPFFAHEQAIADINGDRIPEIVLGGYSPENGCAASGMVDIGQIPLVVTTFSGEILWTQIFKGPFAGVRACVADVIGDANPEVVAVVHNWRMNWGTVAILDGKSGDVLYRREADFSFCGLSTADTDGDRKKEIFVGSSSGRVFKFDGELGVLAETRVALPDSIFGFPCCLVQATNDIDGDGNTEVICLVAPRGGGEWDPTHTLELVYGDERIVILRNDCSVEWDIPLGSLGIGQASNSSEGFLSQLVVLGDLNGDGINEIFCRSQHQITALGMVIE